MILLAAALLLPPCLDPDETSAVQAPLLEAGAPCKVRAAPVQHFGRIGVPPPVSLKTSIRRRLDTILFDGVSARYKWPLVRSDVGVYCGWVNARNRMSAYTGWTQFLAFYDRNYRVTSLSLAEANGITDLVCKGGGYDITSPPAD